MNFTKEEYEKFVIGILSETLVAELRCEDIKTAEFKQFIKPSFSNALHELPIQKASKNSEPVTECFNRLFDCVERKVPKKHVLKVDWFIYYPDSAVELPEHCMTAMVGYNYSALSDGSIYRN